MNRTQTKAILRKLDDLKVQSMMFDMDIDIETFSLVEKRKVEDKPFWLQRWTDKVADGDNQPEFNVDWE